jgi:hypothetical protein
VRRVRVERQKALLARCGAGPCPVELGRELAANKVLVPRVIEADTACVVSLSYVDIKTATAESAATAEGGCDAGSLAATAADAMQKLSAALAGSPPAARGAPASAPGATAAARAGRLRKVSVYVTSSPSNAPVRINGDPRGNTPVRVDLAAGRTYEAAIGGQFPYEQVTRTFVARDWQRIAVDLDHETVNPGELATTTEWFSFALGAGAIEAAEGPLAAFGMRAATFRWPHVFLTLFDLLAGVGVDEADGEEGTWSLLTIGPRVGYPLTLDSAGRHQLMLGAGLCYSAHDAEGLPDNRSFLSVAPSIEYVLLASNGAIQVGGGAHAVVPVAGSGVDEDRPYVVLLMLRFGLSLSPQIEREE